jgi:hypothetical protein
VIGRDDDESAEDATDAQHREEGADAAVVEAEVAVQRLDDPRGQIGRQLVGEAGRDEQRDQEPGSLPSPLAVGPAGERSASVG